MLPWRADLRCIPLVWNSLAIVSMLEMIKVLADPASIWL